MQVTIAGCGIVGATIAYELSKVPDLDVTVLDQQSQPVAPNLQVCPTSTGAALGVLMGVISKKEKGHNLRRRLFSIQYYEQTIPELERLTGFPIPFNREGILMLQFDEDLCVWERLVEVRRTQGWTLEILSRDCLSTQFPQLSLNGVCAAVYSPCDRQVNPVALTHALIAAAQHNGVKFQFNTSVLGMQGKAVQTSAGLVPTDYLVISAGLGSTPLTANLSQPIELRPVLGQAIQVRLEQPLGAAQPVITGNDVHIVPLNQSEYWVGATVEFEPEHGELKPDPQRFEAVMQQAIAICPALHQAEPLRTWYGLRPRPQGRPAPIVEPLTGYPNVLLATGHYRNGVLLAPATADAVKTAILQ